MSLADPLHWTASLMPVDPQINLEHLNTQAYRGAAALERYSVYRLTPTEKFVFARHYRPGDTILDLACGAGRTTLCLHELGYAVKGIDISDTLIQAAQRRFPYIPFEQGSYTAIPSPSDTWNHVLISFNGLDYVAEHDRLTAIAECFRVLQPGGTFTFSSHNIKSFHFSPYYLTSLAGWRDKIRNTMRAFRERDYIVDGGKVTFFGSPHYVIQQTRAAGFQFIEMAGYRCSPDPTFNKFCSPFVHYVFRKPPVAGA